MKKADRCQFHNILRAAFSYVRAAFFTFGLGLYFFCRKEIGAKAARKMLVKLTTGYNNNGQYFNHNLHNGSVQVQKA